MPARRNIAHDRAVLTVGSTDAAENEPPFEQWLREAASTVGGAVTQHEALGIQIRKYYEVSFEAIERKSLNLAESDTIPILPTSPR
jgi:hypothetical protein